MLKLITKIRPVSKYLLIIWMLTIIGVSSIPNIPTLKIHTARSEFRLDYLIHFCEYGLLAFLTYLSFAGSEFHLKTRKMLLLTLSLLLFAVLDEYHQKLIPGRSFNIKDILSNVTGVLAAALFTVFIFRHLARHFKDRNY